VTQDQSKKKILFIIQLPPPVHGASIMNSYVMASTLIKSNFFVDAINLRFSNSIKEISKISLIKIIKSFYYGFMIVKKVLIYKPDLVYFTVSPTGNGFYRDICYVLILKLLKRKLLFHLHGKGIKYDVRKSAYKSILYKIYFKNTHVICLSKRHTDDISEVCAAIPFIVPNGIKLNPINAGSGNRSNDSSPTILYLSNYIREKGILLLIEALGILRKKGYAFHASFVGEPAEISIELIKRYVDCYRLTDCVKISGPLYDEKKNAEFQKADIFVLPTYYKNEAFPLVIIEAFQYGLPVISTVEGGIPDLVTNNESGLLIKSKDPEILADKIGILLKDKNLRIKMGKKGYEKFINNFTITHFESNLNKIFHLILDTH